MSRHVEDLVGVPLMLEPVLAEDLALAEPCAPGGGVVAIPSASSLDKRPGRRRGLRRLRSGLLHPIPKLHLARRRYPNMSRCVRLGGRVGDFLRSGNGSWVGEWEVGEL